MAASLSLVRRHVVRAAAVAAVLTFGCLFLGSVLLPIVLLYRTDATTLERWSQIGQAVEPIGVFYSGAALFAVIVALAIQRRQLRTQARELSLALREQERSSEISLRQLHTDLIKMAIDDPELADVWPPMAPGIRGGRTDHYCNLILNLQKVAYEAGTIEKTELAGVLRYLMSSPQMYSFWTKARSARIVVTEGDPGEDFFTAEVDTAYRSVAPPVRPGLRRQLGTALRRQGRRLRYPGRR
jgi:hypothetical protein